MVHGNMTDEKSIMSIQFSISNKETTHFHQNIEIFYVMEGNVSVQVENQIFEARPEDLIVINSNKKHAYTSEDGQVLIGCFYINYEYLADILGTGQMMFWCNSVINRNSVFDEMRRLMKTICNQYFEKDGQSYVYVQSMYYQLIKILLEHFLVQNDDIRFEDRKDIREDRLVEILNYIRVNYKKRLSLNELASQLYLSVPYLSKYIKQNLGMNFVEYLTNVRLFHAVDDLLYTDHSVTSIAIENGFANTAAFNDAFKKVYHQTPTEYRRQMKMDGGPGDRSEENKKKIQDRLSAYLDNSDIKEPVSKNNQISYVIADTGVIRSYERHWQQMINVGRAGDLLRADMQEHVRELHKMLGFKYIRFWDIFGVEMRINENAADGNYNFSQIDRVLDFVIEEGLIPYIEMGYKPNVINRTLNQPIFVEEREIPFAAYEDVQRFFAAFANHLVNRYGVPGVERWIFEQWCGENFESVTIDGWFFGVFEAIYEALKKVSLQIRVGGGGIGIQYGTSHLETLMTDWTKQKHIPDFISVYSYPYIQGDDDGVAYAKIATDREFLKNQLATGRELLAGTRFQKVPVHVSEWSSTISNRNILNDSAYKAAYIVKNVIDTLEQTELLGYWLGSDIFSEYMDNQKLLFGGCGLISKDGIKKPAFYAFEFLSWMDKYLVTKDKNGMITSDGRGHYSILCHNYKHVNYKYYMKKEDEHEIDKQYQIFEDRESSEINYQLTGIRNGKYKIKTYSVNQEDGRVQYEWMKMGIDAPLSREDVEYLKRICTPRIQIQENIVDNHILNFEVQLKPQEIRYISIGYLYENQ